MKKNIVICRCAERKLIDSKKINGLINALTKANIKFQLIADLCYYAVKDKIALKNIFADDKENFVIGCYPRAVKTLLEFAGVSTNAEYYNLRIETLEKILAIIDIEYSNCDFQSTETAECKTDWNAWYPCIDYDKCVNCKKCVDFCMLGVYTVNENSGVAVVNPENCKDNCPACARMCPLTAIIFPKHNKSPINGGIEIEEENIRQDPRKVYGDIKQKLAERRQTKPELYK